MSGNNPFHEALSNAAQAKQDLESKAAHQHSLEERRKQFLNDPSGIDPGILLCPELAETCKDFLKLAAANGFRGSTDLLGAPRKVVKPQPENPGFLKKVLGVYPEYVFENNVLARGYLIGMARESEDYLGPHVYYRYVQENRNCYLDLEFERAFATLHPGTKCFSYYTPAAIFLCADGKIHGANGNAVPDDYRVITGTPFRFMIDTIDRSYKDMIAQVPLADVLASHALENGMATA